MICISALRRLSLSFTEFRVGPTALQCFRIDRINKAYLQTEFRGLEGRFSWFDPRANVRVDAWGSYAEGQCQDNDPTKIDFSIEGRSVDAAKLFTMFRTSDAAGRLESIFGYFCFRFDPEKGDTQSPWANCPEYIVRIPKYTMIDQGADTVEVLVFGPVAEVTDAVILGSAPTLSTPGPTLAPWQPIESRSRFETRVAKTEAACEAGKLEKVVVARCEVASFEGCTRRVRALAFEALCQRFPNTMVFDIPMGRGGFIGATPETLIRIENGRVETHALAGTVTANPLGMLGDAKLLREHACVTRDISRRLDAICHQVDIDSQPGIREANGVYHLQTPIRGQLKEGGTLFEAIKQLHPTPALCGTPRTESLQWLRQTESLDRGFYGGPVGLFDLRGLAGVSAVAIRSAVLQDHKAYSYAGAGIVIGSVPSAEWDETSAKLAAIQDTLEVVQRDEIPVVMTGASC